MAPETAAALRQSEARYRALFEAIDDAFCLIQLLFDESGRPVDYRFLEANALFEEHTGLQNAVGHTARELVPNLDESWFERYGKVALTGEPERFVDYAPAMRRWFEVNARRVGPPEWRQVGLFFKNVTQRVRAEEEREQLLAEVEATRNRLHNLFENAPAFVASLKSPEQIFEMVNPLYQKLIGAGRVVVGRRARDALPEVAGQGFFELLDRVYQTGESFVGREVRLKLDRHGDGRLEDVYVTFVYQPRRDARGEVEGIDVFGFEVTNEVEGRMRAEALATQLKENEEHLRQLAEFEQQLIGIVSHDLRSPINAINISAATLLRRHTLDERQRRTLGRILVATERANRLIRDLLDFTQARLAGKLPVHPHPMDLHVFARQAVDEVQVAQPDRAIRIVEQSGDGRGEWDEDRLAQVLSNLVTNALAYSPADSAVTVRTRGEAEEVLLEVHNTGEPIPAELVPRLFHPMERGTSRADAASSSVGLGLYIVEQIVKSHGGAIQVSSTAEAGTTFTVKLPRRVGT